MKFDAVLLPWKSISWNHSLPPKFRKIWLFLDFLPKNEEIGWLWDKINGGINFGRFTYRSYIKDSYQSDCQKSVHNLFHKNDEKFSKLWYSLNLKFSLIWTFRHFMHIFSTFRIQWSFPRIMVSKPDLSHWYSHRKSLKFWEIAFCMFLQNKSVPERWKMFFEQIKNVFHSLPGNPSQMLSKRSTKYPARKNKTFYIKNNRKAGKWEKIGEFLPNCFVFWFFLVF